MIALMRAAVLQPKLLVLDEALTSLPEALHIPVLVGLRSLGLHVLIIQHGVSAALTSIPTLTMAQLKRQTSDAS
jgi:ABC-type molybdenum transport system ATPase subunit/photorepair protein PhrA